MRRLTFQIYLWAFFILTGFAIFVLVWERSQWKDFSEGLEHSKEFVIALLGAIVADAFARRMSFKATVAQLTSSCNEAVQEALRYTNSQTAPTSQEWCLVKKSLSTAIDDVRSIFSNVRGLYQFEPLKSISYLIEQMGPSGFSIDRFGTTHSAIVQLWRLLRIEMVREHPLDRDSRAFRELLDKMRWDRYYAPIKEILCALPNDPKGIILRCPANGDERTKPPQA